MDIADTEPPRADLYFGTLIERAFKFILEKREYTRTRYKYSHRASLSNLAKLTGIPRLTVCEYLINRRSNIPIVRLDKLLWAAKISVLDLIEPAEIASYITAMPFEQRDLIKQSLRRMLDKLDEREQNISSPTDSQKSLPQG